MEKSQSQCQLTSNKIQFTDKNYTILIEHADEVLHVKISDSANDQEYYEGRFSHDNIPNQFKFFGEQSAIPSLFQYLLQEPEQKLTFDGEGNLILKLKILKKIKEQALPLQKIKKPSNQLLIIRNQQIIKLKKQNTQFQQTIKYLMELNLQLQKQLLLKQKQQQKRQRQHKLQLLQYQLKKKKSLKIEQKQCKLQQKEAYQQLQMLFAQNKQQEYLKPLSESIFAKRVDKSRIYINDFPQFSTEEKVKQLIKCDVSQIKELQFHLEISDINSQLFAMLFSSKNWPVLQSIWLYQNKIQTVNIKNFNLQKMPKLIHININYNPLDYLSRAYLKSLQDQFGRPTVSMQKQL